eukprot:TRINITY_DN11323_c0_g1_i1.p1 TRINITY_DN11323_c0_g1~~TRINITY_DN11323_c0_g1_i1.p1  ORF type:complete len:281 (+),score=38.51 TRINITY_DN11323_c0_g1_i1:62-904(+)
MSGVKDKHSFKGKRNKKSNKKPSNEKSKYNLNEKSNYNSNEKSNETLNEKSNETLNETSNETLNEKSTRSNEKVIIVLENCCLETVKTKRGFELLNCDDHQKILKKSQKDMSQYRPDIVHQCLLTLLDSPLNKAGRLKVYIHTAKNVLIEIDSRTRIPRTFKRFAGLMVQLLHELKIQSVQKEGSKALLKVIKNPITNHLPPGCLKIGTSSHVPTPVSLIDFVSMLPSDKPVVWAVGGFAKGKINVDWVEKEISFSHYPLSASVACGKICNTFEQVWDIL